MHRFYKTADAIAQPDGHAIHLDGRPVRTPARAPLLLPTRILAQAIAAEWQGQGDKVDPRSMPLTGLANAAIDQVAPEPERFAANIAAYGESDLLCYRVDAPAELVARQQAAWDLLLDWAGRRYDVAFHTTSGIVHVAQPAETLARLRAAVLACDPFVLAPLSTLVSLTGSLILGLALVENAADPETIWSAALVDEQFQADQWGEDADAAAIRARNRLEFDDSISFCRMALGQRS